MTDFIIRDFKKSDVTAVYQIEKQCFSNPWSEKALLDEIENPNAKTDKRLIIFRDSFGSSITPLLAEAYSEITLVDLRYINSRFLSSYVDFENSDVLFLYSTLILNSAKLFK